MALDSFGRAPSYINTAYIIWALTSSGMRDNLDTEIAYITDLAD